MHMNATVTSDAFIQSVSYHCIFGYCLIHSVFSMQYFEYLVRTSADDRRHFSACWSIIRLPTTALIQLQQVDATFLRSQ